MRDNNYSNVRLINTQQIIDHQQYTTLNTGYFYPSDKKLKLKNRQSTVDDFQSHEKLYTNSQVIWDNRLTRFLTKK
jgi:hypothetical protein